MKKLTSAERWRILAFGAPLWATVGLAAQTPTFSVQLLGTVPGGVTAYVSGINQTGEAVGYAGEGTSSCPNNCAVIWQDGTPTVLALAAKLYAEAVAINNAGQVAGNALTPNGTGGDNYTAVVWNNAVPTLLPGPASQYTQTNATSINDAGTVAGYAYEAGAPGLEAIEWNGVTPTVLGTEPGCTGVTDGSIATAINNVGSVVGYILCPNDVATVWYGTTPALLGGGVPHAVNNTGLIVGKGVGGATAWGNGVATPLQTLPGASSSASGSATAVNNKGIIVGTTQVSKETPPGKITFHALVWSSVSAAPQDLNNLISAAMAKEYLLTGATGINESCSIVVNGFSRKDTVNNIAFLLKPIKPSSCAKGTLEQPKN